MEDSVRGLLPLLYVGVLGATVGNLAGRAATVAGAPSWLAFCVWFFGCAYTGFWWSSKHPEIFR